MNKERILQIVEESADIPENQFDTEHWFYLERGKLTMCPIGYFMIKHPELRDAFGWFTRDRVRSGHRVIVGDVDKGKCAEYLGLSLDEYYDLFCCPYKTQVEFADTIKAFINGEFELRECYHCNCRYEALPDDEKQVCDSCAQDMLEMLGML